MCLLSGQKRLEDEYKDLNMLPKVNKADMAGTMKSIEEYLQKRHDVVRAPLAYVIRKNIIVQVYGDYPQYASPDNTMICYTYPHTRISCTTSKVHSWSQSIQQSTS